MQTLDLVGKDGLRLRADAFGDQSDPPVVLFHGGGQTRHAWGATPDILARRGWYVLRVDLRGHGESDWSPSGDYGTEAFAGDAIAISQALPSLPVFVGASLGGLMSMAAIAMSREPVARGLVLVDVAPQMEQGGIDRIGAFMTDNIENGFGTLDEVADAIAAYNPHRPRPTDLSGLAKNVRRRDDGRWVWHWDPSFITGPGGSRDETRSSMMDRDRLDAAARAITIPTLLIRGRLSDLLSEEGARALLALVPHASYVDVEGAGHMVAGDKNDLFNGAIADFLDGLRE